MPFQTRMTCAAYELSTGKNLFEHSNACHLHHKTCAHTQRISLQVTEGRQIEEHRQ